MRRRLPNIISRVLPVGVFLLLLVIWEVLCDSGMIPAYMLPSPGKVVRAFCADFPLLCEHARVTLQEAFLGMLIGIVLAFLVAVLMDAFPLLYDACYPIVVVTQTIPTIAIAPLLVLWMGYDMAPKVTLVVITSFFPITVGLLEGFKAADQDMLNLLRSMGANRAQIFWHVKLFGAATSFFSGLKISAAYAVVSAVISEWLGGFLGLGVYMVRVKKSYSFDKMFAVIFLICIISLLLMKAVEGLQKLCTPWERQKNRRIRDKS
ncbi:ABC-type nitrate/sulfonate/bicarbonate transport system, permease component [Lachnospiraceae bacterium XBB1006]|nr:ABC-type nitrate/sulfonate/bicarbonate transport system, permease component [Lachnospiraceae bacterium XBB1006]